MSGVSFSRASNAKVCMTDLGRGVGLLRACELLEPEYLVHLLKAVKHLSMNATLLEVLQNANAIEILVRILDEHKSGPYSTVCSVLILSSFDSYVKPSL